MGSTSFGLTIKTLKAQKETITNQLTNNSEDKILEQKYTSNEMADVALRYNTEAEMVRNEIESLDGDGINDEYNELNDELKADLREDLKEIATEKNEAEEAIETEAHYKEEDINLENANLEVRLEDIDAQIEAYEEMENQAIEDEYGYFQQ